MQQINPSSIHKSIGLLQSPLQIPKKKLIQISKYQIRNAKYQWLSHITTVKNNQFSYESSAVNAKNTHKGRGQRDVSPPREGAGVGKVLLNLPAKHS